MTIPNISYSFENYIPNGADQRLTVSTAVVQLSAFPSNTTHVFLQCQDAQVGFTIDDGDPDGSSEFLLNSGDMMTQSLAFVAAMKFIRTGGTDGIIHASPLKWGE